MGRLFWLARLVQQYAEGQEEEHHQHAVDRRDQPVSSGDNVDQVLFK